MILGRFIDAVTAHLGSSLASSAPALLGPVQPAAAADLPAVVLSIHDADAGGSGVGGRPRSMVRGALRVEAAIDLADPSLDFADESVALLSVDRRTLQLPHSPLVNADGTDVVPLTEADLRVQLGATTFSVVAGAPAVDEVQADRVTGVLRFAAPLAANGTLAARYFLGEWEVDSLRMRGRLRIDCYAAVAAALETLSRQVANALRADRARGIRGLRQMVPTSWGAIGSPPAPATAMLARSLDYRFDYEHEEPAILTGGGPIRTIRVVEVGLAEGFSIPP